MANARSIPALNGLRAIACLAVFGVHWQQMTQYAAAAGPFNFNLLLKNGNTGVCLFFMLSGFLLAVPLWTGEHSQMSASVSPRWAAGYALRRLARIVPPGVAPKSSSNGAMRNRTQKLVSCPPSPHLGATVYTQVELDCALVFFAP